MRMSVKIEELGKGSVAVFWARYRRPDDAAPEPWRGYVKMTDDGHFLITLLDETDHTDIGNPPKPDMFVASTEKGGAAFLGLSYAGGNSVLIGSGASVLHYRASTVAIGIDPNLVVFDRAYSFTAQFFGIAEWFGLSSIETTVESDNDGLMKSYTISLKAPPDQHVEFSRGSLMRLSADWNVSGREDRRTVNAPVSLSVRPRRPSPVAAVRWPLLRMQELVSLAFDGLVLSAEGRLEIGPQPSSDNAPHVWDRGLMVAPPRAQIAKSGSEIPWFEYSTIGGLAGMARWVKLSQRHRRAVRPLVERFRIGNASAPLALMEVASGIEYWVAANNSTRWASRKCEVRKCRCGKAGILARKVGSPFDSLVGDGHDWAVHFWSTYNALKHAPSARLNDAVLSILAQTGRLLLMSDLLDRVGLTDSPSNEICKNQYRTWQLKKRIAALLI